MPKPAPAAAAGPVLRGLLADIKSHPDDDDLRLILADWLEEQGNPRGEVIRLQCQLARMEDDDPDREALARRAWQVERPHRDNWLGPLRELGTERQFVRGLIHLTCDSDTLLGPVMEQAAATEEFDWVEGLQLNLHRAKPEVIGRALASPHLSRLAALRIWDSSRDGPPVSERWPAGLKALAAAPQLGSLKELDLQWVGLGSGELNRVLSALHLEGLTSLNLAGNTLGVSGAKVLARSALFGRLTRLDLHSNRLDSAALETLTRSPHAPALHHLNLYENQIQDAGARALAHSPLLAQCTWLDLRANGVGEEGVSALAASPNVARLAHLTLDGQTGLGAVVALARSQHLSSLRSLDLSYVHSPTGDEEFRALADSDLGRRLVRLRLRHRRLGPESLRALAVRCSSLRSLNLESAAGVSGKGIAALAEGLRGSSLVSLDLGGCNLRQAGAQALANIGLPATLRWLALGYNGFKPPGLLPLVPALRRLAQLALPHSSVNDEVAKAFADTNMENLTSLFLWRNEIGAEGIKALAGSPWMARVGSLDLGWNPLGDDGIKALAASPYLTGMRRLDLHRTRATAVGALALAESPYLEGVEVLDFRQNRGNAKAWEALRRRFGSRVLL
jgi:uncharacterized protein (TIGR02996 family)